MSMRTNAHSLTASLIVIMLIAVMPATVLGNDSEAEVRSTIEAFYRAFDDGFAQQPILLPKIGTTLIRSEAGPEDAKQLSKRFGKFTDPS
jgi:hypothetical protein